MRQTDSSGTDVVAGLAGDVLERYATGERESRTIYGHDSGPMVLAGVAHSMGAISDHLARQVARRWLDELPHQIQSLGSFGGMGGFLAGVRAGIAIDSEFSSLYERLLDKTSRWLTHAQWRTSAVAWVDYDLFRGPAGLVLAGAADGSPTGPFAPAAQHLARLCEDPRLEGLRAGTEIDVPSAFNRGRINTGMGHGVTGVAAALRHATETFEDGESYRPALRRACDWLVEETFLADRDFITWPAVGRDGAKAAGDADRRQAWCYGTPGIAWTLWDAGRVLGDASLQLLGEEAMRSFCRVFDIDFCYPMEDSSEELAICHGVAGTLAVADAFARHAALPEATVFRARLELYLLDRVNRIDAIANTDMTMLGGAAGMVSVILTARGGARSWLSQLALR
jgi:Lanthionine synthetase C-like protein.